MSKSTYKEIKNQIIRLFEPIQHIQSQRDKFINGYYFNDQFISVLNKRLSNKKMCDCHPIQQEDIQRKIQGFILSKSHRDDIDEATNRIFSKNYLNR